MPTLIKLIADREVRKHAAEEEEPPERLRLAPHQHAHQPRQPQHSAEERTLHSAGVHNHDPKRCRASPHRSGIFLNNNNSHSNTEVTSNSRGLDSALAFHVIDEQSG